MVRLDSTEAHEGAISPCIRYHRREAIPAHGVTERLEFARPMMRRCTGFDANEARRQPLEKRQYVTTLQLTADDYLACCIDAMNLEN
jgi:hypothetical protein